MSDLSDLILPSGLVILGAYAIKRYTENTGQDDFLPYKKTCIGPLCWAEYGPGPGIDDTVKPVIKPIVTPDGFNTNDPLSWLCTLPGLSNLPPFIAPCAAWRLTHG